MTDSKNISLCPLMSVGSEVDRVCTQERCSWYLKGYKVCSVYMLAHNAAMNMQEKQKQG